MRSFNKLREVLAVVAAGLGSSRCSEDQCCAPFAPVYYAVAYGNVTQDGVPVTGIELSAEVFASNCPSSGAPESSAHTRTGSGGTYRLLLSSGTQAEGQCLRLIAAGAAEPVLRTLTGMPFSAEAASQVRDSVQVDLELP